MTREWVIVVFVSILTLSSAILFQDGEFYQKPKPNQQFTMNHNSEIQFA